MRFVVGWLAVLMACGSPEAVPTDAQPVDDDAPPVDAFVGVGESYPLGLNDISMLFQLPADPFHGVTLAKMTGVPGSSGELVPRSVFQHLVVTPGDVANPYEQFHVVALRFDLCDRVAVGPCPAGADGQLRLVFQPVEAGSLGVRAVDAALHGFYTIPAADLAGVINELRAIARVGGFQTASPLAVNQLIASTSPPSEYRSRLRALVGRLARAERLTRLTLFAQEDRPFHWVFRGVDIDGATLTDITIPTVGVTEQRAVMVDRNWLTIEATPAANDPGGFTRALDNALFVPATDAEKAQALSALASAQNPTTYAFSTQQCIGCHVSSLLTHERTRQEDVDPLTVPGTFTSTHDLSIGLGIATTQWSSLRAFGWALGEPVISQRVANESALVLDEIALRFPPGDGTESPHAWGTPALPAGAKRVFVTSGHYPADLETAGNGVDGLDGADRLCTTAATAAGLGGMWTAWLSSSTVDARDRIEHDGPWYLVDHTTLVATNRAALFTSPSHAINLTEHQAQPAGAENVWSGTAADGTATANTCLDWTTQSSSSLGMSGLRVSTTASWTAYGDAPCNLTGFRLYCLER